MAKIKNSYQVIQMNQNQGPISFQFLMKTIAHFKLMFFQLQCRFLYFLTTFLNLDLFLSATPTKGWKKSIRFPDPGLYAESFEKKSFKKSNIQEACQTLKVADVAISNHIISFQFPDTS